ncbi:hypothetical protein LZY01_06040 [Levilactobacillus zymae]|uniref:Uncharacterized protein n=1 Tax=Levilactobacillus zymae TaxID=267363 RepID=A0ABQ0WWJ0_9LACO|nr:hypothetical protein [Levilactobacillus zymae]KRL11231.1 hypothetical protein FD38_GL001743 [Levilactobacillus zymae DSM 19395]GEO71436.1 hypothetical protein LZY01_06040 [Levilactobacillus zymae]
MRLWAKVSMTVLVAGTMGGVLTPSVASAKSTTKFVNRDLQSYYKSAKAKSAFHFATIQSTTNSKKAATMLVMGDFGSDPSVKYGALTSLKMSKNNKVLTTKYRILNFKQSGDKTTTSLSKKTYTFKLTKKSTNKFSAKLTGTKANRRLGTSGKTYTYTRTKTSPAKAYATKYVQPTMYQKYLKAFDSIDATQAQKEQVATKYANDAVTTMVKNFNVK